MSAARFFFQQNEEKMSFICEMCSEWRVVNARRVIVFFPRSPAPRGRDNSNPLMIGRTHYSPLKGHLTAAKP
jgi:hypothetical protein